jgi:hypothetical protein
MQQFGSLYQIGFGVIPVDKLMTIAKVEGGLIPNPRNVKWNV